MTRAWQIVVWCSVAGALVGFMLLIAGCSVEPVTGTI